LFQYQWEAYAQIIDMGYESNRYKANVVRWIDGDTVELLVDLGQSVCVVGKYRLARIDAPETRLKSGVTADEKRRGLALREELNALYPKHTQLSISTTKKGKYGRYLIEIFIPETGANLNDWLLETGKADPY
tara:strand:- start:241 stop:636 length:396 start_codon:yes stop_codon:yes gene_type:complete